MRLRFSLLSALALVALCAGPAHSASGPSATGGGSVFTAPFDRVVFGFAAITHQDGMVTGNFRARSPSTGTFVKADVQCLDVQGNTATFGGFVKKGNLLGSDLTGLCYVAAAQDNGEGENSPADLVSFIVFAPCSALPADTACSVFLAPTVLEVQGNVQVRP